MKLLKMKDVKGNTFHLNPNHVLLVRPYTQVLETEVTLINGLSLVVPGTQEEVVLKLNGEDSLSENLFTH